MRIFFKFFLIILFISCFSCKKDKKAEPDPLVPAQTGHLNILFEHDVDTMPLTFGHKYINQNGDTFQVSKFNYFISNIVITNTDNSTYAEPNSYHVIRHSTAGSNNVAIANVPLGSYKSVSFMLGVDSARNISGAQTGELDPARSGDMYWDWNTGYIFLKFEGTSPQPGPTTKNLTFHIGGYGGPNKTQRSFNLDFKGTTANVGAVVTPSLHLKVDVNKLFKAPNLIKFATQNTQTTPGSGPKIYADNYANMIEFEYLHND